VGWRDDESGSIERRLRGGSGGGRREEDAQGLNNIHKALWKRIRE